MTDQGSLFDGVTAPYQPSSDSSRAGALSVKPVLGSQLERVLSAYRAAGVRGLTDREVHERTGIPIHLIPARRRELQDRGLVGRVPLGRRKSTTGIRVNVYAAT